MYDVYFILCSFCVYLKVCFIHHVYFILFCILIFVYTSF
jgi:hypothetical protein